MYALSNVKEFGFFSQLKISKALSLSCPPCAGTILRSDNSTFERISEVSLFCFLVVTWLAIVAHRPRRPMTLWVLAYHLFQVRFTQLKFVSCSEQSESSKQARVSLLAKMWNFPLQHCRDGFSFGSLRHSERRDCRSHVGQPYLLILTRCCRNVLGVPYYNFGRTFKLLAHISFPIRILSTT